MVIEECDVLPGERALIRALKAVPNLLGEERTAAGRTTGLWG